MIKQNDPVRGDFAAKSTGCWDDTVRTGYYETKDHANRKFQDALAEYGLYFGPHSGMSDDDGCVEIPVQTLANVVGCAVLTWHRMPSGRYEFIGYLA